MKYISEIEMEHNKRVHAVNLHFKIHVSRINLTLIAIYIHTHTHSVCVLQRGTSYNNYVSYIRGNSNITRDYIIPQYYVSAKFVIIYRQKAMKNLKSIICIESSYSFVKSSNPTHMYVSILSGKAPQKAINRRAFIPRASESCP